VDCILFLLFSFVDLHSGKIVHDWHTPSTALFGRLKCVCVNSSWIAVGSNIGELCIIDRRSGYLFHSWKAHDSAVLKLESFGSNGDRLLSSSADRSVCLWDIRSSSPTLIRKFNGHSESVKAFDIIGNRTLLSASGSKLALSSMTEADGEHMEVSY